VRRQPDISLSPVLAWLYSICIHTITNYGRPGTYNAPERAGKASIPNISIIQRDLFYDAERQRTHTVRSQTRRGKPFYRGDIFAGKSGLYPHDRGKAIRYKNRSEETVGLFMAAPESHDDPHFIRTRSRRIGQPDRGSAADISPFLFL
jgi:hypothetical protein